MVHVHGRAVLERAVVGVPPRARIAVLVDTGKLSAMAMVADFAGQRWLRRLSSSCWTVLASASSSLGRWPPRGRATGRQGYAERVRVR